MDDMYRSTSKLVCGPSATGWYHDFSLVPSGTGLYWAVTIEISIVTTRQRSKFRSLPLGNGRFRSCKWQLRAGNRGGNGLRGGDGEDSSGAGGWQQRQAVGRRRRRTTTAWLQAVASTTHDDGTLVVEEGVAARVW
ncbi:hypothetical protein BHM03_00050781 [Ensete ventricosum]|nr:hypothetical protein BHM03_00050781 [Ensete ventricosum]